MFFGKQAGMRILGLPGNPVSAMIGARVFLIPLIAKMLGRADSHSAVAAQLAEPVPANGPRDHYMRGRLDTSTSPPRVTPLPNQDSALVAALADADCLIVNPANTPALSEGASVSVLALDF